MNRPTRYPRRAAAIALCMMFASPGVFAGPLASPTPPPPAGRADTRPAKSVAEQRAAIDEAIARGVQFLQKAQNADGSWGTGLETHGSEIKSMVPGSLDAFRVGTTALCVMALREAGETKSHDRGVEYLVTCADVKRDDGELIYNSWAHIYALEALAGEMKHNHDPRIARAAERNLDRMVRYATYMGGWNYYDFHGHTQSPSMGPTSFGTSAGLVALWEARQAGIEIPRKLIDSGVHRLEEMRLPTGVYLYGSDYQYLPQLPANRIQGAAGRTQPANYALQLWDSKKIGKKEIEAGLDLFFKEHRFLDMGRKRPIPHEAWYQTSGYYYYFDHYYAARLLEKLDSPKRPDYARDLVGHVLPHQEPDGSWWDFAMWDYHKPYGTAFAIMTLLKCEHLRP